MTFAEPTNITSIKGLFDYAETVSGVFYLLIPISLFFVVFLWLKNNNYDTGDCLLASSFTTTITSIFLYILGGLNGTEMFYIVLVLVSAVLYAHWRKES